MAMRAETIEIGIYGLALGLFGLVTEKIGTAKLIA